MLIAAAIALALLALVNTLWGKSLAYPPALFCGVWSALFLVLQFSVGTVYPIRAESVCFYVLQPILFSLGGVVTRDLQRKGSSIVGQTTRSSSEQTRIRRVLDICLAVLVFSIPFYWQYIQGLADSYGGVEFWIAVRLQSIETETASSFNLVGNLLPFSIIIALLMMYEDDGTQQRRLRTWIAGGLSFVMNFLTAGRAGATLLVLALIGTYWVRKRGLGWKFIAVSVSSLMIVLVMLAVLVGKGGASVENDVAENVPAVAESLQVYALGGIVGFDAILQRSNAIPETWPIYRNFVQVANKLGAGFEILPLHAEFLSIGPGVASITNVYTMYFSYLPSFGFAGCSLIVLVLGFVCSYVYWAARRLGPAATVLYALFFNAVLISPYNEQFFLGLNLILKAIIFTSLVYHWSRIKRVLFWSVRGIRNTSQI
jgi:oligosaccharide repeat unit polymerase